jgi:hypothetical protein
VLCPRERIKPRLYLGFHTAPVDRPAGIVIEAVPQVSGEAADSDRPQARPIVGRGWCIEQSGPGDEGQGETSTLCFGTAGVPEGESVISGPATPVHTVAKTVFAKSSFWIVK